MFAVAIVTGNPEALENSARVEGGGQNTLREKLRFRGIFVWSGMFDYETLAI